MLISQQNNGSGFLNFVLYQFLVKEIGLISNSARYKLFLHTFILVWYCLKLLWDFACQLRRVSQVLKTKIVRFDIFQKILGIFYLMHFRRV